MTLYVVRHAHAGQRSEWIGDDRLRPLTERGETQSQGIATLLSSCAPRRLISSPARRCVQTIAPLAEELGIEVVEDDRLFEGAAVGEIRSLLDDVAAEDAVLCSHGDVIPVLLDLLVEAGLRPERNLVWQKASVWIAERDDGGWGTGRYVPPPDRA